MDTLLTLKPIEQFLLSLIETNPRLQPSTKAKYRKSILNYLSTGQSLTDPEAVARYASTLPGSSRSFLKAALKLWGDELVLRAKGKATPENVLAIQAIIYRIEALNEAV